MKTVVIVGLGIAGLASTAQGQSFNIDLDISTGSPEVGRGVPSDAFGAAAGQPGRWNRYPATSAGVTSLVDLLGEPTGVTFEAFGGVGSGGGWNNSGNSGDYRLLLNDAADLSNGSITWRFSGLHAGRYLLFSYAVSPVPTITNQVLTEVAVPGSLSQNPQVVTGPMPGNSFEYLVTHSIHVVDVTGGTLSVTITGVDPVRLSKVNGFQLVAVPEPLSATAFVGGFVVLALRKRRIAKVKGWGG